MELFLIILAFVCLGVGVLGAVMPGLPGPPVAWAGLLLASFTPWVHLSTQVLVVTAAVAVLITLLDYVIPSMATKRFGGSKYGVWGCNIGLVLSMVGLPFGPAGLLGVVFWPFVGALVGEYLKGRQLLPACKAAVGAFVGFLSGTLLKLAYCLALLAVTIVALVR